MQGILYNESNQLQGIEAETKCPPLYQHGLILIQA